MCVNFFTKSNYFFAVNLQKFFTNQVFFLCFNKSINSVKSNSSIIANYSSPAICIRKACQKSCLSCTSNCWSISIKHSIIMSLSNHLLKKWIFFSSHCFSASFECTINHTHSAIRVYNTLKRLIRLKSNDNLVFPINISCWKGVNPRDMFKVNIQNSHLSLFCEKFFAFPPNSRSFLALANKE